MNIRCCFCLKVNKYGRFGVSFEPTKLKFYLKFVNWNFILVKFNLTISQYLVHNRIMDTAIDLERLKKARGLRSQSEVAKAVGVSRQQIWHYENGISEPPLSVLIKLANLYGIKLQEVVNQKNLQNSSNLT